MAGTSNRAHQVHRSRGLTGATLFIPEYDDMRHQLAPKTAKRAPMRDAL